MEAWIGRVGRTGRRGLGRRRCGLGDERDESLTDGDGVGWDGVGRRRRGLGDERDESLRDERTDESLRVMMRVHGEIK